MEITERNESVRRIVKGVKSTPTFSVGDVVTASKIGRLMELFEPDLQMVVAATGDIIGKWCGDPSRTVEVWSFGDDGKIVRQAVDPRFLKLVCSS
jgi:hypothetical protein